MIMEWRPDRLLCKRFDVPNPYYSKDQSEDDKKNALLEKEALNEKTMESLKQERNRMLAANQIIETQDEDDSMAVEDDNQDRQIIEKPSMDIFKAIFADSDSDADVTYKETFQQEKTSVHLNTEEKAETNQSLLFRPVFRKKEERKRKEIPKKNSKPPAVRPSSSGVKLVFDFEEEANQVLQKKKRNTSTVKRIESKVKNRSSSDDEWVEAPQKPMNRPKASDLI
jgi:G patch domain-containing protein 1